MYIQCRGMTIPLRLGVLEETAAGMILHGKILAVDR